MRNTEENYELRKFAEELAIFNDFGQGLINLYNYINLKLESIEGDFDIAGSGMGEDCIDFSIIFPINKELPDQVSLLFFNLDKRYKVTCKEIDTYKESHNERCFHYEIELRL